MATLLPNGKQYYTTNGGLPLVGGKLYTYEAGTLVPKLTYSDADATILNTNPVVLDARGEAMIFWEGTYKVELRDSVDNVIWTIDDVFTDSISQVTIDAVLAKLADTTDPSNGDALLGVKQPDDDTVSLTQHDVNAQKVWTFEEFGALGAPNDDFIPIRKALEWARENKRDVCGNGHYVSSGELVIDQYATDPGVTRDFNVYNVNINQLTYTGLTGSAINVGSPAVCVHVKKLIGPGPDAGTTNGLFITGQGDSEHRVDWVTGFTTNINFDDAYSHTTWVGYCDDAITGVRINGNAIKLYAGRIGGQFTLGDVATDPTTCDVGVHIVSGTANEIHANIEYCKRTLDSIGLRDGGVGTIFTGYLEGCNAFNLHAGGAGTYNIVSANNKFITPASVFAEGDNQINLLSQHVLDQVAWTSGISTMTFDTPGQFYTYGFSEVSGRQGLRERCILTSPPGDPLNQIPFSDKPVAAPWSLSALGAASWGAATVTLDVPSFREAGYPTATRIAFPASASNADLYLTVQSGLVLRAGLVNYGVLLRVASGEIDIQVSLLNTSNDLLSKQVINLKASNKWVNVAARINELAGGTAQFGMQFRTFTGATIEIVNTFLVNEPASYFPPVNPSAPRANIKGVPVDGNTFDNGINVNGVVRSQISPAINSGGGVLSGDYPVYLITGGWTGDLSLPRSIYDNGHQIVVKRDGVAGIGPMRIVPVGSTVDGSAAAIDIAPGYTLLKLIWAANIGGGIWLRI